MRRPTNAVTSGFMARPRNSGRRTGGKVAIRDTQGPRTAPDGHVIQSRDEAGYLPKRRSRLAKSRSARRKSTRRKAGQLTSQK